MTPQTTRQSVLALLLLLPGASAQAEVCDAGSGDIDESCSSLQLIQKSARVRANSLDVSHLGGSMAPLTDSEWTTALGQGDVKHTDMQQGVLGDCYMLAAFVSIAYAHPQIIRNMFVNGEAATAATPVYTTKWMTNGRSTTVAFNDQLPTDPKTGDLFFAHPKNKNYWPALVEKSWAKLFGSYKTIEGGLAREVFKAVTQAPVVTQDHARVTTQQGKTDFWQLLTRATAKKYIMGAVTAGGDCPAKSLMKIYCGHAYAILGVFKHSDQFPKVVKLFNPHGADHYVGKVPNEDKSDGTFYATFDEFLQGFAATDIGEVQEGAEVSTAVLKTSSQRQVVMTFKMESDEPFAVLLEWPNKRFLSGCAQVEPVFTIAVARKDDPTKLTLLTKPSPQMSNARASMPGGAGEYIIAMIVEFPNSKDWLEEFVVNIYGPPTQLYTTQGDAVEQLLSMQGLCDKIQVPFDHATCTYTLDPSTKVNGMPIYRDTNSCAYPMIYWDAKRQVNEPGGSMKTPGSNTWKVIDSVANAKKGQSYGEAVNAKAGKATCGASGLLEESGTATPPGAQLAPRHGEITQEVVKRYRLEDGVEVPDDYVGPRELAEHDAEDDAQCKAAIARLRELGYGSITAAREDTEFPEALASIARPGQECGDSATGHTAGCDMYDHWQSLKKTRAQTAAGNTLSAKCSEDCSLEGCIPPPDKKDGQCLVDFSKCGTFPVKYTCDGWGGSSYSISAASMFVLSATCSASGCHALK